MFGFDAYCKLIHDLPAGRAQRLHEVADTIQNDGELTRWQRNLLLEQVFMKLEPHLRGSGPSALK